MKPLHSNIFKLIYQQSNEITENITALHSNIFKLI